MVCRRTVFLVRAGILLALVSMVGCGPKTKPRVPVFAVKGQAYLKGQPAVGAMVILHPDVGEKDPMWDSGFPRGLVQPDGSFSIGTYEDADGAPAWQYVVVVNFPTSDANEEGGDESPEDGEDPPAKQALNSKFQKPSTSPLKFKVVDQEAVQDIPRIDLP